MDINGFLKRIMTIKLSKEQQEIVNSPEQKIVVIATAGSGKTLLLTERVRWVLRQGGDPSKMVCITYTVNAAEEMRIRLGDDYKDGMFIGTVHSYANLLLSQYGIDTSGVLDKEDFDELFKLIGKYPKSVQEIGFLALDEAQDSSIEQFEFIFNMLNPKNFIVVGDFRQSIFGFSGSNPNLLISLSLDDSITTFYLNRNFRSQSEVISYSNWILSKMKNMTDEPAIGFRAGAGLVETIYGDEYIYMIYDDGNYGDWAILCRTNARVHSIIAQLARFNIPAITFRQAQNSLEDLKKKMEENAVKVLTIHSAKGLQWKKVIVADQLWRSEEDKRLMYVAATRAEDQLFWLKKGK